VRRVVLLSGLSASVVLVALLSFWIGLRSGTNTAVVSGHVYVWICGDKFEPSGCNGPVVGSVVRFEPVNGGQVYKVSSSASGAFSISLPSGSYVIKQERILNGVSGPFPTTNYFDVGPRELTVHANEHLSANFAVVAPRL
jgi:hypothetical protein